MYIVYALDLLKICLRYDCNIPEIYQKYTWDIPKIYLRLAGFFSFEFGSGKNGIFRSDRISAGTGIFQMQFLQIPNRRKWKIRFIGWPENIFLKY